MAPTSHLLKQHIGKIESWIKTVVLQNPDYKQLVDWDCSITDGVLLYDKESGATITPDSMTAHFVDMEPGIVSRFFRIANVYVSMLRVLDTSMVQYAMELEDRRKDLKKATIEEALDSKGTLWLRRGNSVIKIKVVKIIKKMNFRVLEYKDITNMTKDTKTASMRFIQLFLTQEEAFNPLEEGYHDR